MAKAITIEPRAKEVIMDMMSCMPEIDTEGVMEMIEPHVTYDIQELERQARRRMAGSIIRKKRDESGVRDFFSCKDEVGRAKYVNVEKTENPKDLVKINESINKQYLGLTKTRKKLARRKLQLMGQMTLDEMNGR